MYKNMLDKKLISEKEFQKKKWQLQTKLGLNLAQQYNSQMSDMINAIQEAEVASVEAKYDAEIQAAQAAGQDTAALEEKKEAEILAVRKKYAGLQLAIKISEIITNTALSIMVAYAQLGPILGSVFAAMMATQGAAQVALAKAEYDKVMGMQAGATKSSSAGKKKLVSGMLTYDEGNVKRFVGQDGKVYTATEEARPKDGLVTHPIATTVQGQPALVAENGPEIVVGRRTTQAIMMNEPELIKYLANYDRHGGRGYLAYDGGNIEQAASPQPSDTNGLTAADARALTSAIGVFTRTVRQMQEKGIPAVIRKYGRGGLIDEVQSGMKFMQQYK